MTTVTKKPRLTLKEQEKILALAAGYIREPKHWTTGTWKCELIETDEKGMPLMDPETGRAKIARSQNGLPLYQYCVEGAVNQATVDVVGEDRAVALGAVSRDSSGRLDYNEGLPDLGPTQLMGLDEIAFELHGEEMCWDEEDARAMEYNDEKEDHEGVMEILRTGLSRVRDRLRSRSI